MKVRSTFAPGYKTRSCRDCCYERLTMHHQKEGGRGGGGRGREGTCSILAYLTFRLTQQGAKGASSSFSSCCTSPPPPLPPPSSSSSFPYFNVGKRGRREILKQDLERERNDGTFKLVATET